MGRPIGYINFNINTLTGDRPRCPAEPESFSYFVMLGGH